MVGGLTVPARNVLDLLSLSCRSDITTLEKISKDVWTGVDELLACGMTRDAVVVGDNAVALLDRLELGRPIRLLGVRVELADP